VDSGAAWKLRFHQAFGNRRPEMNFIRKMLKNEKGATAIEYGLIAALIAVAAITAMGNVGTSLNKTFNNVSTSMNG
jgi:pilus assembly protein Flp/PilA